MSTWLQPAWQGWHQFITKGKLPAVLFAVLLYLLLSQKDRGIRTGARGKLIYYGAVASALCMFPVTAVFLMQYQTLFYDYPFIWSMVPVTALIAFGGTFFLESYWRRNGGYRGFWFNLLLTGLCVSALLVCGGNPAQKDAAGAETDANRYVSIDNAARDQAEAVLKEAWRALQETDRTDMEGMTGVGRPDAPCLWAPREIMEYVRMRDGAGDGSAFTLLYGRNMWDKALNAYTFDVYSEEANELYLWMEEMADPTDVTWGTEHADGAETTGNARAIRTNAEKAFALGADVILLPKHTEGLVPETIDWAQIVELEQYYLLVRV